ncbi:enoyl-CoA hydratase-related protein [Bosea sp. (in: a-proteobacteria)]|uniref:enoyl-CoA hydratase/isomerase family protein n=1 Tax=Bosea sp. (in: a-proteobacteria) TaxID=1871050 RepID=UPI003342BA3B
MSDRPESVLLERIGNIAVLTLNRPARLNALDAPMAELFLERIEAIAARDDIRAILLKGAGKGFCAGGDVARFLAGGDPADSIAAIMEPLHAALVLLDDLPQPSVACLHGAVAGGGFSLALACDFAVAAETARFSMAYARIGATPDLAGSFHLSRLVGLRKAKEIALLGEPFDAAQALRLGLVNRVAPDGQAEQEALALAQRLGEGPTQAYGRTRRLLASAAVNDLAGHLEAERQAFRETTGTADFREGVAAFLEKRPAHFAGR